MTQRSGEFTRGPVEAEADGCIRFAGEVGGHIKTASPWIEGCWSNDPEAQANAELHAAATNAATTAEDMGYDGLEAVKALPGLLKAVVELTDIAPDSVEYSDWPELQSAVDDALITLAACRTEEPAP